MENKQIADKDSYILPDVKKILAIDDNEIDITLISKILSKAGYLIDSAYNCNEAISLMEKNHYDLILMDHMMPEMDGISLLRNIKESGIIGNTPVIVVTANDVTGARENYLSAGFVDYIPKPFKVNVLTELVKKYVSGDYRNAQENNLSDVLVVDDDIMNLKIAQKILDKQFNVICVMSSEEAFEYLSHSEPELILLDLHMPDQDGFEVLEILTQSERYSDIPIICLTADNERESELRAFRLGASDFITKPFIAEIVRQRISKILELKRLQNNLKGEVEKEASKSRQRRKQLELLTVQVMQTLAGTIDAKDKYTNGHSVRVAEYSREIAKRLNMSKKEQNEIYYMGLLHDIGKIGVPDEIINKTSRLTDDEYSIIKTHPNIGADILKNMSAMPNIVVGARWHHERYDGRGYPDGLRGEEIPAVARIIGVADAYDAMTSNRSYRKLLPQEVIREEIVKGKGTQFDPVFAEIMLKMIDEDSEYHMREMSKEELEQMTNS